MMRRNTTLIALSTQRDLATKYGDRKQTGNWDAARGEHLSFTIACVLVRFGLTALVTTQR